MKSLVAFLSRGRVDLVGEDGRRVVALSLEDTTMARLVKGLVTSRVWIDDLRDASLTGILERDRLSR